MRTLAVPAQREGEVWLRAAAFAALTLILFSAVLDQRNGFSIEMATGPTIAAAPAAPLTTEELIREMLTHD